MYNEINFLIFLREALVDSLQNSDLENKEDAVNYVTNEATDYQVMHYVMRGSFPETDTDILDEEKVFDEYKDFMSDYLIESGDIDLAEMILTEVAPLTPMGMDSAKPYLEGYLECVSEGVITEIHPKILAATKNIQKFGKMVDTFKKKAELERAAGNSEKAKHYAGLVNSYTKKKAAAISAKGIAAAGTKSMGSADAAAGAAQSAAAATKAAAQKAASVSHGSADAAAGAAQAGAEQARRVAAAAAKAKEATKAAAAGAKSELQRNAAATTPGKGEAAKGLVAKGKEALTKGKEMAGKAAGAVKDAAANASTGTKIAVGVAAAAAIAYGAYKVYQKFFSQAAKACAGKPDKGACMASFKQKAKSAQAAALARGMGKCKDDKCKNALKAKIAKLKK